mgnify:CR=1 FL=1
MQNYDCATNLVSRIRFLKEPKVSQTAAAKRWPSQLDGSFGKGRTIQSFDLQSSLLQNDANLTQPVVISLLR